MPEYDYYYRAAWGGELPSARLDEMYFARNLAGARSFAEAKSAEAGWSEVTTIALPVGGGELPVGSILFERGREIATQGLTG